MCKKTCNTAVQLQSALSQLAAVRRENDNQSAIIAACQRDLADRDAEIATLKRARDHQAETITKYQDQGKSQFWRIEDLEISNQERWEKIQGLEREIDTMRKAAIAAGTDHASDHIELVARREECDKLGAEVSDLRRVNAVLVESSDRALAERAGALVNCGTQRDEAARLGEALREVTADRDEWKAACRVQQQDKIKARDQRDEEAKARQRVQIELDKATAIISKGVHVTLIGDRAEEVADLRATVYRLQEYGADRDQEIARLRHEHGKAWKIQQGKLDNALANYAFKRDEAARLEAEVVNLRAVTLNEMTPTYQIGESWIAVPGVTACACCDLREHLANLHRAGESLIGFMEGGAMPMGMIAFIQAHTRAGDALEELAHE